MKIKVSLIESDKDYLERILDGFTGKYGDKLDICVYTSLEQCKNDKNNKADIYLVSDRYTFEKKDFPVGSEVVYFVESKEISSIQGEKTIAKYQKLDDIYKEVADLFADISGIVIKEKSMQGDVKIYAFTAGSGGCGKTTLSVSTALKLAMKGQRVVYVSFEAFGNTDVYFERNQNGDLGNIIYSIKSKKNNIGVKIGSVISKDFSGVSYISSPENSFDIASMNVEDIETLISEISTSGQFDCIVIDMDVMSEEKMNAVFSCATNIICVTEECKTAIEKMGNFIKMLHLCESKYSSRILEKTVSICNKTKRMQNTVNSSSEIRCVGSITFISEDERRIVDQISKSDILDSIL